jgi:hypothetical protein
MRLEVRKHNLPSKYGITTQKYNEMLEKQENKCACCGVEFDLISSSMNKPCVDHNHSSGETRDILCSRCNLAAGNVNDSSDRAEKLAAYLRKWKC